MSDRSTSLPEWVLGGKKETPLGSRQAGLHQTGPTGADESDGASPVAKLLMLLQSLLNGTSVDMAAVKWLWMRIATGDFVNGGFPTDAPRLALKNLDKEVSAALALMLGPVHTRRGSKLTDMDIDQAPSTSNRSSVEMLQSLDTAEITLALGSLCQEEEIPWTLAATPVPEEEAVLRSADSWGFDAFRLAEVTVGHPLSSLGFWLLNTTGIIQDLGLDKQKLWNYLRALESRYAEPLVAPYHSCTHAADVLQQMHQLLTVGGLALVASKREPLTCLAAYLAAIMHDVDHQGVNNDFLVRSEDRLALVYNDASPQEQHHVATAYSLLRKPDCNFLRSLSKERRSKLRQIIISMVLATDMKLHVGLYSAFKAKVDVQAIAVSKPLPTSKWRVSDPGTSKQLSRRLSSRELCIGGYFDTDAGQTLIMQIALKCADLGHASAPWEVHQRWVVCLEEEMFLQGDREAAAKMPISPLMDRRKHGVSRSQCDFLDVVALPLFRLWAAAFPGAAPIVKNTEANFQRWRTQMEAQALKKSKSR